MNELVQLKSRHDINILCRNMNLCILIWKYRFVTGVLYKQMYNSLTQNVLAHVRQVPSPVYGSTVQSISRKA